jgi:hypothetical protein
MNKIFKKPVNKQSELGRGDGTNKTKINKIKYSKNL